MGQGGTAAPAGALSQGTSSIGFSNTVCCNMDLLTAAKVVSGQRASPVELLYTGCILNHTTGTLLRVER